MRKTLALAAAALLAAPAAFAQPAQPPGPGPGPRGPERMFELLDANRDGRVTRDEALAHVGQRFQQADSDRDGAVSLAEFQAMTLRPAGQSQRAPRPDDARRGERRAAMFRAIDANSDGRVTMDEVQPVVLARFRAMDANADGAVTRDEVPQRHAHRGGPGRDQTAPQR